MKSDYFDEVPPAMVKDMVAWAEKKPGALAMAQLHHLRRRVEPAG